MSDETKEKISALEADLLIQNGIIESLKGDTIRQSAKFMKALENKIRIIEALRRIGKGK